MTGHGRLIDGSGCPMRAAVEPIRRFIVDNMKHIETRTPRRQGTLIVYCLGFPNLKSSDVSPFVKNSAFMRLFLSPSTLIRPSF